MDVNSPMPGRVLEVLVSVGDRVEADQEIVLLESMKMEVPVTAPSPGRVATLVVAPGDSVEEGALLLALTSV